LPVTTLYSSVTFESLSKPELNPTNPLAFACDNAMSTSLAPDFGRSEIITSLAIEAIYEAAVEPDLWPQALSAIARMFDARGTVLLYDREDGSRTAIVSPRLEAAVAECPGRARCGARALGRGRHLH
jgi:hypothetical protein